MGIKYGKMPIEGTLIAYDPANIGDWIQMKQLIYSHDGSRIWATVYECPNCKFNTYENKFNYCPICGKKLKA